MGVVKGWGVSCIFMLKSRSGDMNVCKKKYNSNNYDSNRFCEYS